MSIAEANNSIYGARWNRR